MFFPPIMQWLFKKLQGSHFLRLFVGAIRLDVLDVDVIFKIAHLYDDN